MTLLQTALAPIEATILNQIETYVTSNKPAIINKLKAAEVNVVQELGTYVVERVNDIAILKPLDEEIAQGIAAVEPSIIAALGGPDEALYALLLHELAQLKTTGLF